MNFNRFLYSRFFRCLIPSFIFLIPILLTSEEITIVSYNILSPSYLHLGDYSHAPNNQLKWEYRKDKIVQRVLQYSPEVICLQEVEEKTYSYISKELSKKGYVGHFNPNANKVRDGVATFYLNEKLGEVMVRGIFCDGTSECERGSARSAIISTIKTMQGNQFNIINTKFKWMHHQTPLENHQGWRQAIFLKEKYIKDSEFSWVIAADFNVPADHQIIKVFTTSSFTQPDEEVSPWTCYANGQNISTDYILFQKDLNARAIAPLSDKAVSQIPNENEPSDHLPQILIISFPGKSNDKN